jgi:predicted nucleotidyltransferase
MIMKDWNKALIKKAMPLVEKLKEFREIKAIVFYGAVGYGYADEFSDIDLILFCTKRPKLEKSRQFLKDLGIKVPSKSPFAAGFVWRGKEWTIWIETLDNMESYIRKFLKKDVDFCRQNMEEKIGNYLFKTVVVWDPGNLTEKWKKNFSRYPMWLKKNNFDQLQLAANRIGKLIHSYKRKNQIVVLDSINLILMIFIHVLYALNDRLYPSTMWFFRDVESLEIKPKNCLQRMDQISGSETPVSRKIFLVQQMFKELEKLCRKQVPRINLTRDEYGNIRD